MNQENNFINEATKKGEIPSAYIEADSIPEAHYKAIKTVWENGIRIRTQYDRKNEAGEFIDPPSADMTVTIRVNDPWKEPRYPPLSFCEIGTYIAEIMGAKDHYVVPFDTLIDVVKTGKELTSHEWPYTYHQRLTEYPGVDGKKINQLDVMLEKISKDPYTRRAIANTAVPFIDPFLKEDLPCLRELWFRAPEDENGNLVLNVNATWRSRDLYKAWPDNLIGISFLQGYLARQLKERTDAPVKTGRYVEMSNSLHIYGQDFSAVKGNQEKGMRSFFENFKTVDEYIKKSMTSETAREYLVVPQLKQLLTPAKIKEWRFGEPQIKLIEGLVDDLESRKYLP